MKRTVIVGAVGFMLGAAVAAPAVVASKNAETSAQCERFKKALGKSVASGRMSAAPDWSVDLVDVLDQSFCGK